MFQTLGPKFQKLEKTTTPSFHKGSGIQLVDDLENLRPQDRDPDLSQPDVYNNSYIKNVIKVV